MPTKTNKTGRRDFLHTSAAAGLTLALQSAKAPAVLASANPNDKINLGFIGIGNRGTQLLHSFMKNDDMRVGALCDVYEPYLQRDEKSVAKVLRDELGGRIPRMPEKFDGDVPLYSDFRRLLEQKDLDAVVIATPDHWHAIQTLNAFDAGKDVYVEKPLSSTIHEGRAMADAAKRTGRINQVGLHRRSSKMYRKAGDLVQSGTIGKVSVARAYRISNMYPDGIGKDEPVKPVPGLDWEMWLGPRADRDYQNNIHPYKFRWWDGYSSQVGNWGVHYFDSIRWVVGEEAPVSICAMGGRFGVDDDRTIPDTMEVTFELPSGMLLVFGQYEANSGKAIEFGELEFRGTLGNLYTGSEGSGYKVIPSKNGQFQTQKSPLKEIGQDRMDNDLTDQHTRNFLDCVKSRAKCNCEIEIGHRSTTFAHLANISLATRSRIDWDAKTERITNNDKANEYLHYEYRKPWKLG